MLFWADSIPFYLRDLYLQYNPKLNVWTSFLNYKIIGLSFVDKSLTTKWYLYRWRNKVIPTIREVVDNDFESVWFRIECSTNLLYFSDSFTQISWSGTPKLFLLWRIFYLSQIFTSEMLTNVTPQFELNKVRCKFVIFE